MEKSVGERLLRYSGAELEDRLERASLPYARMCAITEVVEHPEMAARDRWTTVGTSAGPVTTLRPPVTAPQWAERTDPVPAVGEHTERVLQWIGMAVPDPAGQPAPGSVNGRQ